MTPSQLYPVLMACICSVFVVGAALMFRQSVSDRFAEFVGKWFLAFAGFALLLAFLSTVLPVGGS